MILHPSKNTMERHNFCHILFFFLTMNKNLLDPFPVPEFHSSQLICQTIIHPYTDTEKNILFLNFEIDHELRLNFILFNGN